MCCYLAVLCPGQEAWRVLSSPPCLVSTVSVSRRASGVRALPPPWGQSPPVSHYPQPTATWGRPDTPRVSMERSWVAGGQACSQGTPVSSHRDGPAQPEGTVGHHCVKVSRGKGLADQGPLSLACLFQFFCFSSTSAFDLCGRRSARGRGQLRPRGTQGGASSCPPAPESALCWGDAPSWLCTACPEQKRFIPGLLPKKA